MTPPLYPKLNTHTHTMERVLQPLLLFFIMYCMMALSNAQEILQNPDFEIPPSNITTNSSTSQFILLTKENPIPGWSFKGTVSYVTSGANLSFPGNSGAHAVQLGENGTISQTIKARGLMEYVLSFNLIPQSEDCANNRTAVNVSVHGKYDYSHRSKVFSLGRNLSMNLWESYAFFLGRLAAESLNLHITSVNTTKAKDANNNVTCWPIVDAFTVRKNRLPMWEYENRLANGDFEIGPAFLKNSSEGILLDEEQKRFDSPLQEWSILGTIKYIDSINYKVPRSKAAIELVSADLSGIQIGLNLETKSTYTLNFTMGDANNSCAGDFTVYVQVADNVHNFTMRSNGTGSAFVKSITFKSELPSTVETSIAIYSFNETRTSNGMLCGPVIDNIILKGSNGGRIEMYYGVLIFGLFGALVMLMV
ncbi:hypothetical protein ABFX02_11G070000 [Erythranthe guttata]